MSPRAPRAKNLQRLSTAEWEMMRICWDLEEATVQDVLNVSRESTWRDYKTVLTFLARMEAKGYVKVRRQGRANLYRPALGKDDAIRFETTCFLREIAGDDPEDIEIVRQVVEQAAGA